MPQGQRLHLIWSRLKALFSEGKNEPHAGQSAPAARALFVGAHWRHKKYFLPMLAMGVSVVILAAVASLWLLEQRMENIQTQQEHKNLKTVQPTQSIRPLPQGQWAEDQRKEQWPEDHWEHQWENVLNEIYSNKPAHPPPHTAAKQPAEPQPQYQKNARNLPVVAQDMPKIAIIIDDVGVNVPLSMAAAEKLPPEVTFSYLPYGSATKELVKKARQKNREVMIHLPMEPMPRPEEPPINPGEDALFIDMSTKEIRATVQKNLGDLQRVAVGVNNHMGSRFTAYKEGMMPVLTEIDNAGLFFLDSLTTHLSDVNAAADLAAPEMPLLVRDMFLDHTPTKEALGKTLLHMEKLAKKQGTVIAIGHPHKNTTTALANWIPTLKEKGIALVPISHMLKNDKTPKPPLVPASPVVKNKKPPQTDLKHEKKDGLY